MAAPAPPAATAPAAEEAPAVAVPVPAPAIDDATWAAQFRRGVLARMVRLCTVWYEFGFMA